MTIDAIAWLILRVVYAWMFLWPLIALLKDWPGTVATVSLLCPYKANFSAVVMVLVMIAGALSILFGFYGQVAGLVLLVYNIFGVFVHRKAAQAIATLKLSNKGVAADQKIFTQAQAIGVVGHITSSQKNWVLASVACFFMLMGTGPLSVTGRLFF